jgi:hypothetical protein
MPPPRRSRTGLTIVLSVVAGIAVAVGMWVLLGGGDDSGGSAGAESFDDVQALVDALDEQDIDCDDFEETEPLGGGPFVDLNEASSAGSCTVDDVLLQMEVYESAGDGEENIEDLVGFADCDDGGESGDGEPDLVSGGNWLVGAFNSGFDDGDPGEVIADVADALGGRTWDLGCDS